MKFPIAACFCLLLSSSAFAVTTCELTQSAAATPNNFSRQIFTRDIAPSDEMNDTQFVYIKPNGKVVNLTWKEVNAKKSFADLDGAKFFTFKIENYQNIGSDHIEIGTGDVDVSRKEVRRLRGLVDAVERVGYMHERNWAVCYPQGERLKR